MKEESAQLQKSALGEMVDKMCQLHPECENYHDTKVMLSEEFLKAVKGMQGTDLEPYLAETKCSGREGCFLITFKIPLVSYGELRSLQS